MENYKIFTFGGAGNSIANTLLLNSFGEDKIFYFDTDQNAINSSPLINKFLIGKQAAAGKSTNADTNIARIAFNEDKDLIKRLITTDNIYVLMGGFGGGVFSGMITLISALLKESNKAFIIISTFPLKFEGNRMKQAVDIIEELNHHTDKLILLKTDDLQKSFGDLSVEETFRKTDHMLVEIVKEMTQQTQHTSEIINKSSILLNPILEDIILQIKAFITTSPYLIATSSSKIIVSNTNKEILKALTIDPEYVHTISPRKFEELIAYIYTMSGLETELTKQSRDNGADILVWTPPPVLGDKFLTVIQAKRYIKKNKVGSGEIRELGGTSLLFKADKAQMITTSDYSKPAIETAKSFKIDLLRFYELNETIKGLLAG
ncbi:restriction endonuclease [Pedobacter sp. FW305-3-2-15-E-R2A2]|uniref:restriction endonuclease n=1 Tax=Pedobacter sp. FW305-3-2-15-E-R2A2 TaxID=3140251 RepID=UPI00314003E4